MRSVILRWCVIFAVSSVLAAPARAGAISSYTVTDLGVVPSMGPGLTTANFSAPAGTSATVTAQDGTVYAFPRTDSSVANPNSLIAKLPVLLDPSTLPPANGSGGQDLHYLYRDYTPGPAFLNKNGIAVESELQGVSGHGNLAGSSIGAFQRQADGTFVATPFGTGISSPDNRETGGIIAQALDLNNRDQLLGTTLHTSGPFDRSGYTAYLLSDLRTGITTDLQNLLPAGWYMEFGRMALDDQGQVVVYADQIPTFPFTGVVNEHAFLLTPAGLSSAPLATPEPTALATLALAGLGLLIRRRWKS